MARPKRLDAIRQKLFDIHDHISTSHYVNHPNLDVGDVRANDVVLFSLMTGFLNRNQLFLGNYGLGKTTTAEAVSSLVYGLPLEFVEKGMIQGHPQLTEEKIVGRLDFSKLSETEKVIFSIFAQTPSAKILDEITRLPEGTQNMLLRAVETGQFLYLNEAIDQPKYAFFATANYEDGGSTRLLPPLLDRYDVSVEVGYPMFLASYLRGDVHLADLSNEQRKALTVAEDAYLERIVAADSGALPAIEREHLSHIAEIVEMPCAKTQRARISNKELSDTMQTVITDKTKAYAQKMGEIAKLSAAFREQVGDLALTDAERQLLPYALTAQRLDDEAQLFLDAYTDHMNSVLKVNGHANGNHTNGYAIGKVRNNLSVRANVRSAFEYARALSFLKGEERVSVDTIAQVLPYVIAHRTEFSDAFKAETDDFQPHSARMALARSLVGEFRTEDYVKHRQEYAGLYAALRSGTVESWLEKRPDSDNPLIKKMRWLVKEDGGAQKE